jgi:predicted nuclease of restriction endonuclease-like (RecB) superfamily
MKKTTTKKQATKKQTTKRKPKASKAVGKSKNEEIAASTIAREVNAAYRTIADILQTARAASYRAVNQVMVQAYWQIGRVIVEREQQGQKRAGYGEMLIEELSKRLAQGFGKGFDRSNLWHMRKFYRTFPNFLDAPRRELSWTHYRLLLRVENEDARNFYLNETSTSNWSTRELDRQIDSLLYERLALSRDKKKVRALANEGQILRRAEDLIKDPYVLEFLDLQDTTVFREKDLEQALIDRLQKFLLELGKGFALVARQKRITVGHEHYYIDLVLYNFVLKCFVLLDFKVGRLTHQDIGQMDFYVRYFEAEERQADDKPTIGLILCSDKNEAMVQYTLLKESQQIFASKYQLYLPTEEELQRTLQAERARLELEQNLPATEDSP